jgi:EAL domain-containing protein (putative c-di-GMP-specific phosphodiesterase class I)
MRLADGQPVGVEVLLRWISPQLGNVPPDEFIPIAEDTGLIADIGAFVLRRACQDAGSLARAVGRPLVLCVNVSALQLSRPSFVATVDEALADSGLPADCLEIELTERVLIDSRKQTEESLRALRSRGVGIAIDDFGTGYSALSYLNRFPVTTLKIDRSFVRDIEDDPRDAALVKAIVGIADSLELRVIAEGVETAAQLAFLRAGGCSLAQGYLFAKPEDAVAAEQTLLRMAAQPAATPFVAAG